MQPNITKHTLTTSNQVFAICLLTLAWLGFVNLARADIIHNDDVAIQGNLCVGSGCMDGDTNDIRPGYILVKSATPSIDLDDTDAGEADWSIRVDASFSESLNILNRETGTRPFIIENGAPENALRIDDQGNVGLGTGAPARNLHIVGGAPQIRFDDTLGTTQVWDLFGDAGEFRIRDETSAVTPFRISADADLNSIVIGTGGNVGLGIFTPTERLHVEGSAFISGTFRVGSSRSSKRDIQELNPQDARTAVQHLSPVRFLYKDDDQKQLGFIAEELPALIATKDGKSLRPMDVVTLLTSVVQQHDRQNDLLEKKIKQQDEKLKQQNEMMALLMERIERLEAPHELKRRSL